MNPFQDLVPKSSGKSPFGDLQRQNFVNIGGVPLETETQKQQRIQSTLNPVQNIGVGIVKGGLSTLRGMGELGTKTAQALLPKSLEPRMSDIYNDETEEGARAKEVLAPQGTAQNIGFFTEKTAEFLSPSSLVSKGQGFISGAINATKLPSFAKGALGVAGRAVPEAVSAGTVSAVQSGGFDDTAKRDALIAGGASGVFGTLGSAYRGIKNAALGQDDTRLLIKAIRPTGALANKEYDSFVKSLPESKRLVQETGVEIKDLPSLKEATDIAKKKIWSTLMGKIEDGEKLSIPGYKLSREIYSVLDDNAKLLREKPEVLEDVVRMASTYSLQKPLTLPQAEELLEQTNAFLRAANAANPSPAEIATLTLVKQMNIKLADALRQNIDEALTSAGKEATLDLRKQYAGLAKLSRAVNERIPKDDRLASMSLGDQFNMPLGISKIIGGIGRGDIGQIAEGSAQVALGKAAKNLNQADELIKRIFGTQKMGSVSSRVFGGANKTSPGFIAGKEAVEAVQNTPNKQGGFAALPNLGRKADDLVNQAKKYKSAEEFVKAQGTPYYHGTGEEFDNFDLAKSGQSGFYFTRQKDEASKFASYKNTGRQIVKEVYLDIKNPAPKEEIINAFNQADTGNPSKQVREYLIKRGYDGYYGEDTSWIKGDKAGTRFAETVAFYPEQIKTPSQLTDIWNKANKITTSAKNNLEEIALRIDDTDKSIMEQFSNAVFTDNKRNVEVGLASKAQRLAETMGLDAAYLSNKELAEVFNDILEIARKTRARIVPITTK